MKASKLKKRKLNCPSCGAPVSTEFCPYCGVLTGLDSSRADMEYPVLDCKEVIVEWRDIKFVATMGAAFALIGVAILVIFGWMAKGDMLLVGIMAAGFMIFGIVLAFSPIVTFFKYACMRIFGKKIKATVYGYLEDDMTINGRPAQVVKLLIKTPDGPKFILYQLQQTVKPFGIKSEIDVYAIGDAYMIRNSTGIKH